MVAQLEKNTSFRSLCYDRQEKHQRREKKMTIKEFIKKSRLKTWDVIIIAILVLGSFLPLVVFAMQNRGQEAATYQAVLKVDNKVIKVFDLKGRPALYI